MLLVFFLPIVFFTLSRMIRDQRSGMPLGVMRHMQWSVSELAKQAEPIPRELLMSWLESMENASGLKICVRRNGENFYLPDSEWLVEHILKETDNTQYPPAPIVVSSVSHSDRTKIVVGSKPGPRRHNVEVFLMVAVLCAIFSFMLVRNFMTPLAELQRTTLQLANGDLSARVGQSVVGRGDEIADLGRRFNNMGERVENLISSQKRLLSDISHEIRSPLQRMEVASALLRDKSCTEPRKYIDRIELEIRRIDKMVEELLTLTRTDEMNLRSEIVELDEVINSIVEDVQFGSDTEHRMKEEKEGEKKKFITVNVEKVAVIGDVILLNRALGNVIHNAIHYTESSSGIEINTYRKGNNVTVNIRDYGKGISEEDLEKIFLPYYRTEKARERSRGGVGLGLAITKRIVEKHGGTIKASNAQSGGLVVAIMLPCADDPVEFKAVDSGV
ncbi:MAG: HAMP domain-containing protein [Synergistaceae bacterium]|nr:HAMP domain-containing protein [Synergistaceae bacterium]